MDGDRLRGGRHAGHVLLEVDGAELGGDLELQAGVGRDEARARGVGARHLDQGRLRGHLAVLVEAGRRGLLGDGDGLRRGAKVAEARPQSIITVPAAFCSFEPPCALLPDPASLRAPSPHLQPFLSSPHLQSFLLSSSEPFSFSPFSVLADLCEMKAGFIGLARTAFTFPVLMSTRRPSSIIFRTK